MLVSVNAERVICRGTLPYMAPELVNDPNRVSEKADVWSLGMVCATAALPLFCTLQLHTACTHSRAARTTHLLSIRVCRLL